MSLTFVSPAEQTFWQQSAVSVIGGIQRGLEKESLRITADGLVAQTPHPKALGSSLTNKYITTDYSEALLEFITPPCIGLHEPLQWLDKIHRYTYQHLDNEILWCASMPCMMGEEKDIPIAQYGSSNSGKMKMVYREGLGKRYGRFMQTIAGIHYNFSISDATWQALYDLSDKTSSFTDFKSQRYMGMIRNYNRNSWIIPFFFGASPAVCESFLKHRPSRLDCLVAGTRYGKYATSLRMSDLGYQNNVQSQLKVSINSLDEYIDDLEYAIKTEDPYYLSMGVKIDDQYTQLNANLLQIENEFYSNIRPKRTSSSGERPTKALRQGGVEYLEVRALDLNLYDPIGISQYQLNFIDVFLLHCLMHDSPLITERELAENKKNFSRVVKGGRDPEVYLWHENKQVALVDRLKQLFAEFELSANILDQAYQTDEFSSALECLNPLITNPELSLSGQIVMTIEKRNDGFFQYAYALSKRYGKELRSNPLDEQDYQTFADEARDSIDKQQQLEASEEISFEQFLANYFAD
ncbi:MAG: glutamate--cysteine ligase [Kangiellaceae bacterium]|jgi:glutamate--cysteine ligase|nr:glutamate--cysteine ligase [Kangiellaceae bacterium]